MVEVGNAKVQIGLFIKIFRLEIYSFMRFNVSADLIVRAHKTSQVKSRAGSLNGLIDRPHFQHLIRVLLRSTCIIYESTKLLETES